MKLTTKNATDKTNNDITKIAGTRRSVVRAVLRKSWDLSTKDDDTKFCEMRPISGGPRNLQRQEKVYIYTNERTKKA